MSEQPRPLRAVKAALIFAGDSFRSGGAVLIDGDRIADVVDVDDVPAGSDIIQWGDVAVLPGTVGAHGHAFQSLFKGYGDDRSFESWRDDVLYPFSERLDGDAIYAGALFAFSEALLAGITTTVDFFYLHDSSNENAERVVLAARDAGIRLVLARAFYDPDAPTQAPARYREPVADAVERCREFAARYRNDPFVSVQPAPHSLHAALPVTIGAALELARELDVPCHLHVAEASYEVEVVKARYGVTPVRLLAREGLLDHRLVAVHSVWVDDDELDLIADAGAGVVHCPSANAFLGDGMARLPEMLERGIRVGLGPDGGCANNRQSVFDEMRQASLVAKARTRDGAALDARSAFRLGTAGGADIVGLDAGEIAPGKFADLVALDLNDLSLLPRATLEYQIVHSLQPTAIRRVMVGGRVVVDRSHLTRVDLGEVAALVDAVTGKWVRP